MTRVFDRPQPDGGARLLVLGAAHYPYAQVAKLKVPQLTDISSAGESAFRFARAAIVEWKDLFAKPLASVDLLVNDAAHPDGALFECDGQPSLQLAAPTLANIIAARNRWLEPATAADMLIFYCCGHGIWLPSASRTFLASDFGLDEEAVWPNAIALDDFKFGLAERLSRLQWLMFDCCANVPPPELAAARPAANPLLETRPHRREIMTQQHGPLSQAVVASSSPGAHAFGREGGASRFMDVFIEACGGAGFRDQGEDDRWWLNLQGLEAAMSSYRVRVAEQEDESYYTFARLTESDALETPKLMGREAPAKCTLVVTSDPAFRLKQCDLSIHSEMPPQLIARQPRGPRAKVPFRKDVEPWEKYRIDAAFQESMETMTKRALPPFTEAKF